MSEFYDGNSRPRINDSGSWTEEDMERICINCGQNFGNHRDYTCSEKKTEEKPQQAAKITVSLSKADFGGHVALKTEVRIEGMSKKGAKALLKSIVADMEKENHEP